MYWPVMLILCVVQEDLLLDVLACHVDTLCRAGGPTTGCTGLSC